MAVPPLPNRASEPSRMPPDHHRRWRAAVGPRPLIVGLRATAELEPWHRHHRDLDVRGRTEPVIW